MLFLPGAHQRSFMHGQIVQDDVDGFSPMSRAGLIEEFYELSAGVAWRATPEHFPARYLQGCEQRNRAMADVLDGAAFRLAGPQGQSGLTAIQRLHGRLFIDAKKTAAFLGGSRYKPRMSFALASNWGSGLAR